MSLPSFCSLRDTEPKMRSDFMPNEDFSSSAWDAIMEMYSFVVFILIYFLLDATAKIIDLIKYAK